MDVSDKDSITSTSASTDVGDPFTQPGISLPTITTTSPMKFDTDFLKIKEQFQESEQQSGNSIPNVSSGLPIAEPGQETSHHITVENSIHRSSITKFPPQTWEPSNARNLLKLIKLMLPIPVMKHNLLIQILWKLPDRAVDKCDESAPVSIGSDYEDLEGNVTVEMVHEITDAEPCHSFNVEKILKMSSGSQTNEQDDKVISMCTDSSSLNEVKIAPMGHIEGSGLLKYEAKGGPWVWRRRFLPCSWKQLINQKILLILTHFNIWSNLQSRTSFARICIEVSASGSIPSMVHIDIDDSEPFEHVVEFEWKPNACSVCNNFLHEDGVCKAALKPLSKDTGAKISNQSEAYNQPVSTDHSDFGWRKAQKEKRRKASVRHLDSDKVPSNRLSKSGFSPQACSKNQACNSADGATIASPGDNASCAIIEVNESFARGVIDASIVIHDANNALSKLDSVNEAERVSLVTDDEKDDRDEMDGLIDEKAEDAIIVGTVRTFPVSDDERDDFAKFDGTIRGTKDKAGDIADDLSENSKETTETGGDNALNDVLAVIAPDDINAVPMAEANDTAPDNSNPEFWSELGVGADGAARLAIAESFSDGKQSQHKVTSPVLQSFSTNVQKAISTFNTARANQEELISGQGTPSVAWRIVVFLQLLVAMLVWQICPWLI